MVEWGAVRESGQPGVPKSGQGLFAGQVAHTACEFVGSGVKMAGMVTNGRDLIG